MVDRGEVDLLDVVRTLCALGNVEPSQTGESLHLRVLDGPGAGRSKTVVFGNLGYVGLRTPPATLVWDQHLAAPVELYDRDRDPQQLCNLVQDASATGLRDDLVSQLRERVLG